MKGKFMNRFECHWRLLGAAALAAASWPALAEDGLTAGVGVAVSPAFAGAEDYRVRPLPIVEFERGALFANFRDGVGYRIVDDDNIELGASLAIVPGYRRRDMPEGIRGLSAAAGVRLFARASTGPVSASVGATRSVAGGTGGTVVDATLAYAAPLTRELVLIPSVGLAWANRRHNDRYFGITPREAAASGLSAYRAGSGLTEFSAGVTGIYRLGDTTSLSLGGRATRLANDAADSPLVERRTGFSAFGALSFRFR